MEIKRKGSQTSVNGPWGLYILQRERQQKSDEQPVTQGGK